MKFMLKIKKLILKERSQYLAIGIICSIIIVFSTVLFLTNPISFQRFFGNLNPLLIIFVVIILFIVLSTVFLLYGWFKVYRRDNSRGILYAFILATSLSFVTIAIDIIFKYPEDINVLFPYSLIFYPTMGFVVEILFHVLPLSLILSIFTLIRKNRTPQKIIWISIVLISLLEPVYQLIYGTPTHFPLSINFLFGFYLFLFNFIQLTLFKRYDFLSMYSFRLVYYIIWHILWGYLRLVIFF